jgi:hypothetical protein
MAKAIESKIDLTAKSLTITVAGYNPMTIDLNLLNNQEILTMATLHGFKQKLVDSASLPNGATLAEKYDAIRETFTRITAPEGTWNKQGEGASGQPSGLLFRALCRMYPGKTPDALRTYLDKLDKTQQAALRKNPKVAAIIETIKAESAKTTGIDSDNLLADLDAI